MLDVRCLSSLGAMNAHELNSLTLGQRLVALLRDGGEVDENVLATLTLDESIALLVREPLHGALSQTTSSFKTRDGPGTEPPLLIQRPECSSDARERKPSAAKTGSPYRVSK